MPRTRPAASALRAPLAYALGTPAKVAALRVLAYAGDPMSQREVARRARIQHRSAQGALDDLVTLGIVTRAHGGRDHLVHLNGAHRLVAPIRSLLAAEAEQFLTLRQRLTAFATAAARRTGLVSLVLFGSAARGDDRPDSDCDLLVVSRTRAGIDSLLAEVQALGEELRQSHGCRLHPILYSEVEAKQAARAARPPFPSIARDGLVLFGSIGLEPRRG